MLIENGCSTYTTLFFILIFIFHTSIQETTIQTTKYPFKLRRWNNGLNISSNNIPQAENYDPDEWFFKDYIKKFRPINVWERYYQKKRAQGINVSIEKNFEDIINGIDETDELLRIKLDEKTSDGRRSKWSPPGRLDGTVGRHDPFSVRRRLYELILHTMYWTRNKMIIMQTLRRKYRNSKIYKMGFMTSKNDIACKMFHRFAYRAITSCLTTGYYKNYRYVPLEMLHAEERLLSKWMDITLMTDLIEKNDISCKEMLEEVDRNREQAWVFYD